MLRAKDLRRSAHLTVGAQWAKRIRRFCTTVVTFAIAGVVRVRRAVLGAQGRWGGWRRRWPATALEDDLVNCNVAVVSGPPARALAVDAEANLSCAGRDNHVHLLPIIIARPAHASCVLRHMERLRGGRRAFWAEHSRLFSSCPGPDHPGICQIDVECIHLPGQTYHGSNVAPRCSGIGAQDASPPFGGRC